jgi:hypothetical protein
VAPYLHAPTDHPDTLALEKCASHGLTCRSSLRFLLSIILDKANEVIRAEAPELAGKVQVHLPDEANRRVGQAIAAASLPAG